MSDSVSAAPVIRVGPSDGAPVLLLHSWWGVRPAVREWADSLARAGRRVLIPDLFGGQTADAEPDAMALLGGDPAARLLLVEGCADELAALGRPWAAVGFSMGAMYACHLASRGAAGPDEIVLFYGGASPGGEVTRTRRAQLHWVRDDEYFTDEEFADTESGLRAAGVDLQTFEYPGGKHWFAERDTPGFDDAAFELARSRVVEGLGA